MNRRNKKKVANWVLFSCTALTIGICAYSPTTITAIGAGFCTGLFIANLIDKR